MNNEKWRSWCRLCASIDTVYNIKVNIKDEPTTSQEDETTNAKNLTMIEAIERYFYVNLSQTDITEELPHLLCMNCVSLITSLEMFAERVSRVQKMFDSLNWTTENSNLDAVRLNFRISEGDHFVFTKQLKTEAHYFSSERQTPLLQEVDSLKNLDTEDPLKMLSQRNQEILLDAAVPKECELEEKDDNHSDIDDVDNGVSFSHSWDSDENTEAQQPLKKQKTKRVKTESNESGLVAQKCTVCHKKYIYIRRHMKLAHSIILPPEKHQCTECDFVSDIKCRFKRHMLMHTPQELRRIIPCKYCDQKFASNHRANIHMRQKHMKVFRNMCDQCGMTLNSSVSLRIHKYMHEGHNPFKCEVCGRGFKVSNKLKLHMEVHSDITFPCPQCGREFQTRLYLRRHMVTHSDVKRFKCNFCESSFKSARTLKNHLIMHTGLKMFNCTFCDRTFTTSSSCRLHKRTMHPEELAAFEAAGNAPPVYKIPTLAELRAMKMPTKFRVLDKNEVTNNVSDEKD